MAEISVTDTIDAIDAAAWDACQRNPLEGHAYLAVVERAQLAGFAFRYVLLKEGRRLIGAAPMFVTRYPLETTLEGGSPPLLGQIRRLFPAFLAPRLACVGSPCTESAPLGLLPGLSPAERTTGVTRLLEAIEMVGAGARAGLLGIKDLADVDRPAWGDAATARGFTEVSGLPTAWLPIDFPDVEAYLARLSSGTRRDMRRKLRSPTAVRIEQRDGIDDIMDRVMALYGETLGRAAMRLETLTADYFRNFLAAMPGRAFATLYWAGDDLLAINLLLRDGDTLLDKYFCMAAAEGRRHALYFLSWFTNIRYCLDEGLTRYVAGQGGYAGKVRLGCRLEPTTMYFRHRQTLVDRALRLTVPMLAAGLDEAA